MKEYPIVPVAKPRMTQRDKWARRPPVVRYFMFKADCQIAGVTVNPSGDHVTFIIPMPHSWSKKKRANLDGKPHQLKPDIDNLTKALFDAVLEQDCGVWDHRATKRWGMEGKIIIQSKEG